MPAMDEIQEQTVEVTEPAAQVVGTTPTGEPVHKLLPAVEPKSDFRPELLEKQIEKFPEADAYLRKRYGVDKIELVEQQLTATRIELARQSAITKFGFTEDEAAIIPGASPDEVLKNAENIASLISKRVPAQQPEQAALEVAQVTAGNTAKQAPVKPYDGNGEGKNLKDMTLDELNAEYRANFPVTKYK